MRNVKLCLSRARSSGAYKTEDTFQTLRGGVISSRLRFCGFAIISISPRYKDTPRGEHFRNGTFAPQTERKSEIYL